MNEIQVREMIPQRKGKIMMMEDGIREQQWANGNILGEVEHIIHKLCNTHGDQ
jgi:hypothetical protein